MEQHEKGFQKVVRKDGLFMKDLNLGLFDPLEDVKDGVLLDEEEIVAEEDEVADEGQDAAEQGDDVVAFSLFCWFCGRTSYVTLTIFLLL